MPHCGCRHRTRRSCSGKLVLVDLPKAALGHTCEAWLIGADKVPRPAGTFAGAKALVVSLEGDVRLDRPS